MYSNSDLDFGIPQEDLWMSQDADGDGLTNQTEIFLGTDPYNPDSDRDGLLDSQELFMGSSPLHPDTDSNNGIDVGIPPFLRAKQVALSALEEGFAPSQIQDSLLQIPELQKLETQNAERLATLAINAAQYQNAINSLADQVPLQPEGLQSTQQKMSRRNP